MSDTRTSDANEPEADSLDMKSNINNCDETSANEKELVNTGQDEGSVKDEASSDLPANGHQREVNGGQPNGGDDEGHREEALSKTDDDNVARLSETEEETSLNDLNENSSCADESKDAEGSVPSQSNASEEDSSSSNPVTNDDSAAAAAADDDDDDNEKSQQSLSEIESESNTVETSDEKDSETLDSTQVSEDANEPAETAVDSLNPSSLDDEEFQQSEVEDSFKLSKEKEESTDTTSGSKSVDDEMENKSSNDDSVPDFAERTEEEMVGEAKEEKQEDESKVVSSELKVKDEEKMDVDSNEQSEEIKLETSEEQAASSQLKPTSSNVITEVVVGNSDEVTLDLTKTLTNGVKLESLEKENDHQVLFTKTESNKRNHSSISEVAAVEDLSLPSKRRAVENGNVNVNGTVVNEEEEEEGEDCDQFDEMLMPPTPPQDDLDEQERIRKIKLYRRLKQELLNEDAKLVLLKKMRQSQLLKENISQNQAASMTAPEKPAPAVPPAISPAGSVGVNLSNNNLRDLNLLASHYHQSLSQQQSGSSTGALNFSTSHNSSKQASSLVNNNAAHSNSHSSLYPKGTLVGLNMAHQAPMQAHLPKTSSHVKGNSVLNPPFGSSLGRSPYNHLNSHLSAPPPSLHGSSSSSKQRSSYDSPNLNTAHSSHRTSGSLNATSLNPRASMATPPNHHAYSDLRQSSSSSKFAQHISQSASPSPTIHNQISESQRPDPLLAQRQAANVKQVLRKQLEKMPQPKVPPPEMHFIPNPSNPEFIYYIGLEKVVDYLTDNNQVFQPPDPFECVQCGTDFTPVWKWKDHGDSKSETSKPAVICEKCVSSNMKKAVTDEHTKRINTFSKAYEELEKQMASAAASAGTVTPPSASNSPSLASTERIGHSTREQHNAREHSTASNLASASHNASHNSSGSNSGTNNHSHSHNLFGSNNSAATTAALAAAAAANFGSLGALSGLQHQQAHSNSPLSSLTAQQMAAMAASFLPQASNTANSAAAHQMSTPPAAHSSSRSSNSFASNLAAAFTASNANAQAQSAAATLALLQQLPKMNSQATAQSLLLAQQLQAFSALAGGGNAASSASNAAMAQLLGFPTNLIYSSLLAASLANQKSTQQQQQSSSSSTSSLNAAAAALQRQLLMDILPGVSGNSRSSGHHSASSNSSSMPHHNWKS